MGTMWMILDILKGEFVAGAFTIFVLIILAVMQNCNAPIYDRPWFICSSGPYFSYLGQL